MSMHSAVITPQTTHIFPGFIWHGSLASKLSKHPKISPVYRGHEGVGRGGQTDSRERTAGGWIIDQTKGKTGRKRGWGWMGGGLSGETLQSGVPSSPPWDNFCTEADHELNHEHRLGSLVPLRL